MNEEARLMQELNKPETKLIMECNSKDKQIELFRNILFDLLEDKNKEINKLKEEKENLTHIVANKIIKDYDIETPLKDELNTERLKSIGLKNEIEELKRKIEIKDRWCQLIWDIGCDYDGYNDADNLKKIIDELVNYSNKAISCDDTTVVYSSGDGKKENILFEEITEE